MNTPSLEDLDREIARLATLLTERDQLMPRRTTLQAAITKADAELASLTRLAGRATATGPARLLASLRGGRADAAAAGVRLPAAREELAALRAQLDDLGARLDEARSTPSAYAAALAAKEKHLRDTGHPTGERLSELAGLRGDLVAELARLQRAEIAAGKAAEGFRRADELLGSAGKWSAYDTFMGGGAFSSHVKHQRVESADDYVAAAQHQVDVMRHELGDDREAAPISLEINGTTKFLDVMFDNIFTDLAVRSRINRGQKEIVEAFLRVREVRAALTARTAEVRTRLREIETERDGLLVNPSGP
ncbi:hypothetical protein GCM10010112_41230 [Actinoplanes lobatus]|uniref:Putative nucleic acid-binding Zn-ribbon protein n=1 Tax=Actinoplanes lobatus TaxID=113568 RepID=A0A7W7HNE9_9ACTN|nr:hypothetical protein [Actinoplanes lobatus]MBB4753762.1 putative nucleic acid-binding Zn-ribbon protein [Actinoplanes lobatus]GGN72634.1 hypothetical protein GCM10010112_41230 [Actinoplanes lobatus]GIE42085.1 hypothetical protein Alo02nite_49830 [Actinoplanes lobatus]